VVSSSINNLVKFAKAQGINYKTLKVYNPWLRGTRLENPTRKKVYRNSVKWALSLIHAAELIFKNTTLLKEKKGQMIFGPFKLYFSSFDLSSFLSGRSAYSVSNFLASLKD
jgi:hypothetical protein